MLGAEIIEKIEGPNVEGRYTLILRGDSSMRDRVIAVPASFMKQEPSTPRVGGYFIQHPDGSFYYKDAVIFERYYAPAPKHDPTELEFKRREASNIRAVQWNIIDEGSRPKFGYECKDHPGVRGTSYSEVFALLGTSGCSRLEPYWDWSVMGVIETNYGKHVVVPGDWIVEDPEIEVLSEYVFHQRYMSKKKPVDPPTPSAYVRPILKG